MNVYEIITDRIIARIEKEGALPWKQPWKNYLGGSEPQNMVSKKPYRGINQWMLRGLYPSPYFLTFKQAQSLGGCVRKGEKAVPVVYWRFFEDKEDKKKRIPMLRYYSVFNVSQCDGIDIPQPATMVDDRSPIEVCEHVIADMPNRPRITHEEARAYYRVDCDTVNMPVRASFPSLEQYYATAFHELAHSTGHKSRLARHSTNESWGKFGSDPYAKEELIAEMTAAYLCGYCGIDNVTEEQSAAYLKGWIKVLREKPSLLVQSASGASKASDFILGRTQSDDVEATDE